MTSREGLVLPTWFLASAVGAFMVATGSIVVTAVGTWSDVRADNAAIQLQGQRIAKLEQLQTDMAALKQDVMDTKALALSTNDKLDRLIDRQLEQNTPAAAGEVERARRRPR